jgi:hypothetical protein
MNTHGLMELVNLNIGLLEAVNPVRRRELVGH